MNLLVRFSLLGVVLCASCLSLFFFWFPQSGERVRAVPAGHATCSREFVAYESSDLEKEWVEGIERKRWADDPCAQARAQSDLEEVIKGTDHLRDIRRQYEQLASTMRRAHTQSSRDGTCQSLNLFMQIAGLSCRLAVVEMAGVSRQALARSNGSEP